MSSSPSLASLPSVSCGSEPLAIDVKEVSRRRAYRIVKRAFDIVVSIFLITLFSPMWVLLAILIKIDSLGPVLFVNRAIGLKGAQFSLLKFRSMHAAIDGDIEFQDVHNNSRHGVPTRFQNGKPIYKTALVDEKRITRIGRFLRKSSLDEVPQLWNIFQGDMSMVGPRPALPREVAFYSEWQKQRFLVKPGLTGLYQVTARNHVPVEQMIRIDLEYVRTQSFWLDVQIICKTPFVMVKGL